MFAEIVLILAHADRLRINLDQLGERILKPPGDRDRSAQGHVEPRQFLRAKGRSGVDRSPGLRDDDLGQLKLGVQPNERGTEPVGPVPSPAEELPLSLSVAYYEARDGSTLARADVTYLRQDFSIMMEVENAKPWPKMQRFDFLIRTRVLTGEEITQLEKARMDRGPDYVSPHRQAVLSALRRLTGLDAGVNAPGWRQAVADRAK